jgi:hypothetical protein
MVVVEMIEIFGDWLLFDGKRLVELSGIEPALRMRLEAFLHGQDDEDQAHVDLSDLVKRRVLVDTRRALTAQDGIIVGQHPNDHDHQPVIPDDTEIATVVDFDELKKALTNANIGFDE